MSEQHTKAGRRAAFRAFAASWTAESPFVFRLTPLSERCYVARIRFVVAQEKGAAGVRITAEPWVARRVACPACGCSVAVEGSDGR